jgi:signal transduction histidine kinase
MSKKNLPSLNRVLLRLMLFRLVLPSVFVAVAIIVVGGTQQIRLIENKHARQVQSIALTVDEFLIQSQRSLYSIALFAEDSTPAELSRNIQATWQALGYFDTIFLLDEQGIIRHLAPANAKSLGFDMSAQEYFRATIKLGEANTFTPFRSAITGQPTVNMTWLLSDGRMLVGELNLGLLQRSILANPDEIEEDIFFITNPEGALLAHSDYNLVDQQVILNTQEIFKYDLSESGRYFWEEETVFQYTAVRVATNHWIVVVKTAILEELRPYFEVIGIISGLTFLFLALILWSLYRESNKRIISPLNALVNDANLLSKDESALKDAFGGGLPSFLEINTLQISLAHMADAIQSRQLELQKSQARLQHLTQQVILSQEDERMRISHELFDESGQMLSALNIQLEMIAAALPRELESVRAQLADANQLLKTTLTDLRTMAHDLRPPIIDTLEIEKTIQELCTDFCNRSGMSLTFQADPLPALNDNSRITLYRFTQEVLTNIAKHAQAQTVQVEFRHQDHWVSLSVRDDGVGFDPANSLSTGMGLERLRERLSLVDGQLEIDSHPEKGTCVTATITQPSVRKES